MKDMAVLRENRRLTAAEMLHPSEKAAPGCSGRLCVRYGMSTQAGNCGSKHRAHLLSRVERGVLQLWRFGFRIHVTQGKFDTLIDKLVE